MRTLSCPTKWRSAGGTTAATVASASTGIRRSPIVVPIGTRACAFEPSAGSGGPAKRARLGGAAEALLGAGACASRLDLAVAGRRRGHELREEAVRRSRDLSNCMRKRRLVHL